jgi:ribose/xylose/arabinose/galactoside ABC-type transport system permease subunit
MRIDPPAALQDATRRPIVAPRLSEWRSLWPLVALGLIMLVDAFISPGFFSIRIVEGRLYGSLVDILYRGTPTALVALGMAIVIGARGIDLSVGAIIAIAGAVMTELIHHGMAAPGVLLATLLVSLVCGLWNGALVAFLDIQPIIATLILMVAGRGVAQMIDAGTIVTFRSDFFSAISTGRLGPVPSRIVVAAAVYVLTWAAMRRTALGLFIESVGSNAEASRLTGIDAKFVTVATYAISGIAAGIAGILITSDIRGSDANNAGLWMELDAILAVVLGGGSLNGGRVYIFNTLIGVLIIQSLTTSILVSGLPPEYNLIVKAIVVFLCLLLQARPARQALSGLVRGKRT